MITPPWMLLAKPFLLWKDDQDTKKTNDLTSRIEMTAINQDLDIEEKNDLLGGKLTEESELKIIE